jgi:hypothetical protein
LITWRIYLEVDVLADHALQHIAVAGLLDRQHVAYYRVLVAHTVDH